MGVFTSKERKAINAYLEIVKRDGYVRGRANTELRSAVLPQDQHAIKELHIKAFELGFLTACREFSEQTL